MTQICKKNQSNYRLKQYLDVINKYLDNSKYPIYVFEYLDMIIQNIKTIHE